MTPLIFLKNISFYFIYFYWFGISILCVKSSFSSIESEIFNIFRRKMEVPDWPQKYFPIIHRNLHFQFQKSICNGIQSFSNRSSFPFLHPFYSSLFSMKHVYCNWMVTLKVAENFSHDTTEWEHIVCIRCGNGKRRWLEGVVWQMKRLWKYCKDWMQWFRKILIKTVYTKMKNIFYLKKFM